MTVLAPTERECLGCGEVKPLEAFHRHPAGKHGRQARCRVCMATAQRDYWADMDPAKRKRRKRKNTVMHKYGLVWEQYEALHASHGGLCGICRQPETKVVRGHLSDLSVDHDHETGAVRGLLCSNCNAGIGMLGDDPERLEAAAEYLRRVR